MLVVGRFCECFFGFMQIGGPTSSHLARAREHPARAACRILLTKFNVVADLDAGPVHQQQQQIAL
jgi:hypothetical protein